MTTTNPYTAFFNPDDMAKAFSAWQSLAQSSLRTLNEPILPGWTINVDSFNSGSPEAERDILKMASYGKQIGRLADAVDELIKQAPDQKPKEFKEFRELKALTDDVKKAALEKRVARMPGDLALLKATDKAQFELVKKALLAVF